MKKKKMNERGELRNERKQWKSQKWKSEKLTWIEASGIKRVKEKKSLGMNETKNKWKKNKILKEIKRAKVKWKRDWGRERRKKMY